MVVAIAYTGARWSEIVGLTPECVDGDTAKIDWKLYELNGRFYRGRPKDGSIRPADLPPFLAQLFSAHLRASADGLQCTCRNTEEPWFGARNMCSLAPAEDTSAGPTTARGSSGQPLTAGTCRGRGKALGLRFQF